MNTREKVLTEALKCVNGEREKQYGSPEDNFKRIADFWSLYLTTLFEGTDVVVELDPKDVAMMMVLFKIARSLGDQDKLDNYVDIIGYAACGAEIFGNDESGEEWRQFKGDPFTYYFNKMVNYASFKSKENHFSLENLRSIDRKLSREFSDLLNQAATDCVLNDKQLDDCYKEIDELFKKYVPNYEDKGFSYWKAYDRIASYITLSSREAHISQLDVVKHLTESGNAPTNMAGLLMTDKISFDDVTAYVDEAIKVLKSEDTK